MKPLNTEILAAIRGMPLGGGYRFTPTERAPSSPINPRDPLYDGVSSSLIWRGEAIADAAADGATYCCGATLEVWWRAWSPHAPEVSAARLRQLVSTWFCPTMGHPGVAQALADLGWGTPVAPEDAQPGDLCQFWRRTELSNPSGHSVVFLSWGDQGGGRSLRYWSSQPATQGLGTHEELVGPSWELHFVRAIAPVDAG